jgi:HSP20 family protein
MLDLWNVLNDVMRNDPWFTPFSAPTGVASSYLVADVAETDGEYWITAELPGVPLENVKLEIENDMLTLSAEKLPFEGDDKRNFHHVERRHGTYSRAFSLPRIVDRDGIQATMKDGLLTIRLPKAEQARPRQIPVRVGALGTGEAAPRQITEDAPENQSHG